MASVAVIVPCYNSAAFIGETIGSVLRQSFIDWELHLVDDGSSDETWTIISAHASADRRMNAYRKENGGTGSSRNYGAAKASPEARYLLFLDHDDQLEAGCLRKAWDYMELHPHVGLLGFQYSDVDAQGRRLPTGRRSRWVPGRFGPRSMRDGEIATPFVAFFCATGQGPFALFRRSIFLRTTGWETSFWPHEDTDIFCQMALEAEVHFIPDRLYLKRIHAGQGMRDYGRLHDAYLQFRKKWDAYRPRTDAEEAEVAAAKRYYYCVHAPWRSLRYALKALRGFVRRGNFGSLRWGWNLAMGGLKGMVLNRIKYRAANRPRYAKEK